ncbi:MAG: MlaD family protein [Rhodospirillales bacterium]
MSKKANPRLTGSFVIGAVALLVLGVIVFGSGRWFAEVANFVSYFRGSVQGLGVGSPVTFRGVPIGQVRSVELLYDVDNLEFLTQVLYEIDPRSFRERTREVRDPTEQINRLVESGLRAQLIQQSFVTGQLAVQMDMFPGTPAELLGLRTDRFEIPTTPSTVEELEATIRRIAKSLDALNMQTITDDIERTAEAIRELVTRPSLTEAVDNANGVLADARDLLAKLESRIDPLATSVDDTARAAREAIAEAQRTFATARTAVMNIERTLARAEALMTTANTVIEPGSPLHFELVSALREVSGAARSFRSLANALERNPNLLLFGRQAPGGR